MGVTYEPQECRRQGQGRHRVRRGGRCWLRDNRERQLRSRYEGRGRREIRS